MADITTKYKSKWTGAEIDDGIEKARNAVPLDGSKAMTGNLTLNPTGDAKARGILWKHQTSSGDNGMKVEDTDVEGDKAIFRVSAREAALYFNTIVGGSPSTSRTILHTGNKPSGSYTGNGSAAARTIATGGIGNVCVVYSDEGIALLTSKYGYIITPNGAQLTTGGFFRAGNIILASSTAPLNSNGKAYDYQVL